MCRDGLRRQDSNGNSGDHKLQLTASGQQREEAGVAEDKGDDHYRSSHDEGDDKGKSNGEGVGAEIKRPCGDRPKFRPVH